MCGRERSDRGERLPGAEESRPSKSTAPPLDADHWPRHPLGADCAACGQIWPCTSAPAPGGFGEGWQAATATARRLSSRASSTGAGATGASQKTHRASTHNKLLFYNFI
jgi:hypothetical protein